MCGSIMQCTVCGSIVILLGESFRKVNVFGHLHPEGKFSEQENDEDQRAQSSENISSLVSIVARSQFTFIPTFKVLIENKDV